MKLQEVSKYASNRRSFLKGVGLTGIGLAGAAVVGTEFGSREQKVEAAAYTDTDILNFALNLEYLEAEFYAVSTYNATLVELGVISQSDTTGPTTGGNMVKGFSSDPQAFIATGLRDDEINHVLLLRSALGSAAVKKPAINLAAKGYGFASIGSWLELARQLEEVGMSAYLGAAPLISSANLATAAAILTTEAQHSGALRTACIQAGISSPAVDSLDEPPTSSAPFHVTSQGLSVPRTPAQVLNVVYAGGSCSGGFYPEGMNGTIVCQSQ